MDVHTPTPRPPHPDPALPLAGVRVLALEQLQSLPIATQILARFGADVVKVEPPGRGDLGRGSLPAMTDAAGARVGATFIRNNLGKRSICVDLKAPEGRDLVLRLAGQFDVVAENSKAGSMAKLGLGYEDVAAAHPHVIYASVSGFGNTVEGPYQRWLALAPVVEAMSGMYEMKRDGDRAPTVAPMGAFADVGAGLYATIGLLVALRHRDLTGRGQYVDIAMFDSVVAMTDIAANFWSMGLRGGAMGAAIMDTFRASDGWFVMHVLREPQFASLMALIGRPELVDDERFAQRQGWVDHLDTVLRPAIEAWAADLDKVTVCDRLSAAGIPGGPSFDAEEVARNPHLAARRMLVEVPRVDGVDEPVLVSGNPAKLSDVADEPEGALPTLGQHTDEVLRDDLGLPEAEIAALRAAGVVA